VTLIKGQS